MKEIIKEIELKNSTFHNFNKANNKPNIVLKVNEMNENVNNDIQLISKLLMPLKIRKSKNKNDNNQYIVDKKNLEYPLIEKKYPNFLKININSNLSRYKKKNKLLKKIHPRKVLISSKKNINNNNIIYNDEKEYPCKIIDEPINKTSVLLGEKNEKDIYSMNKNTPRNNKSSMNFQQCENKKINCFNSRNKVFPIRNLKNASYNYYITANQFNTIQSTYNNSNENNSFLNHSNNNNILVLNNSFNKKNEDYKLICSTYKDIKNRKNSYSNEKSNNIAEKLSKIDLKFSELEKKINKSYHFNYYEINKKKKDIQKIKEKCKALLKELDKKNNFELQQIIREINDTLLSLDFKDFFGYLLTLLKNYDKKIVNWSYDIVEEKNECPEELKYKNVRYRHKKFMGILNRQYITGLNVNNHVNYLINNSRDKLGENGITSYNKYNRSCPQDKHKDKLLRNNYNNNKTKYYETFLKIKKNNL
jgi:hypothetical protein